LDEEDGPSGDGGGRTGGEDEEEAERARAREKIVAGLEIVGEGELVDVTDEVDRVIWTGDAWKAPDMHGIQMGYIHRAWPIIADQVRAIFKSSVRLGLFPTRLKSSNAIPTPKAGKKDKTSPKAY
jgi:hypothetical protein